MPFIQNKKRTAIPNIDPKDFSDRLKLQPELQKLRGQVLSHSISIERQLDYLLSGLLFQRYEHEINEEGLRRGEVRFFEEFILNSGKISFSSKINLFQNLSNMHPILTDYKTQTKKLIKKLDKLRKLRNYFAHGEMYFPPIKRKSPKSKTPISKIPCLRYFKKGKIQEKKLDFDFFEKTIYPLLIGISQEMLLLGLYMKGYYKKKGEPEFFL